MPLVLRTAALLGDEVHPDVLLTVDGSALLSVVPVPDPRHLPEHWPDGVQFEHLTGCIAVPGYVDIHCHGAGGGSFASLDADDARTAARALHATGTTSIVASLVSMSPHDLVTGVGLLADLCDEGLLDGIHLEGPWIAPERRGAHDPAALRAPDLREVTEVLTTGRGHVRQVTMAPELDGGIELIEHLLGHEVVVAIGHTRASHAQARAAIGAGASLATHLFNGMDPWHHREPGALPALLLAAANAELTVELIADGVHLSDETALTVIELVGAGNVAFVSDATSAAGLGDGRYELGGVGVLVRDGVARVDGEPDTIAGGTHTLSDIVAGMVAAGLPLTEAVQSASATGAREMGIEAGLLAPGRRADLLVLGPDARPQRVMRAGEWLQ